MARSRKLHTNVEQHEVEFCVRIIGDESCRRFRNIIEVLQKLEGMDEVMIQFPWEGKRTRFDILNDGGIKGPGEFEIESRGTIMIGSDFIAVGDEYDE